jgi:hypothetical protein
VGVVERCAGSFYCGVVHICLREGCVGKKKVMPVRFPSLPRLLFFSSHN